jgi:DNA repair protein RecO (recombination protein O)
MALLTSEAIVLHAFDYSETSRILRLATREGGVVSVLARGARRSRTRFGTALDLFAQGAAEIHFREGRDLQTLAAFDVSRQRASLGEDLGRFAGASALAELVLRFATDAAHPELFDALAASFDDLAAARGDRATEVALAGSWRLVAELGFSPALELCAACHAEVDPRVDLPFSHTAGGVLCSRCAPMYSPGRVLPADARALLVEWTGGRSAGPVSPLEGRAHQRLLREFLQQHLADGRVLHAFDAWEHGAWSA